MRYSGKAEIILPAREISFVPILIPAAFEKNRITGSSEALASSGASSTIVYNMSGLVISAIFFISKLAMDRIGRLVKELIQKGPLKLNVSYNNGIYNSIALIDFPATYPRLMAVNNPLPER